MRFTLPEGLLLGVSTTSTQIEGGEVCANRNDWYHLVRITDGTGPATGNDHWVK